jgi:hypothetical protein
MKKLKTIILCTFLIIFSAGLLAQNINNVVTVKELVLKKSEIPNPVSKTIISDLNDEEPLYWSTISELVNSNGLNRLNTKDGEISPDNYEVKIKTTNGNIYTALYDKDGELISWKAQLKDGYLPVSIQSKLKNENYNDWRVLSDVAYIREYKNNTEKYYVVKLKKGRQKKTLYFDEIGMLLTEK